MTINTNQKTTSSLCKKAQSHSSLKKGGELKMKLQFKLEL